MFSNASGGNNLIKVLNTSTHAVIDTITLPGIVSSIVMSPDGATLYAVDGANNYVYAVDTSTRAIGAPIAVGASPNPIVWALSRFSPDAIKIDAGTHTTTTFIPDSNPATMAVLDVIYAASNTELHFLTFDGTNGAVWVYLLPGLTIGGPMGGLPAGPFMAGAVDATQDILWLIDMGSATINSFPGGATAPVGAMPWSIGVRPDGLEVWVPTSGG